MPRDAEEMNGLQHVLVASDGPITTITLNRPEKRNALALDVMLELTEVVQDVGSTDALGVVLAANGPVFSAGHNFGDMAGADLAKAQQLFDACTRMMDAFQQIPQPVVALIGSPVSASSRARLRPMLRATATSGV